jgi:hypothetical protein
MKLSEKHERTLEVFLHTDGAGDFWGSPSTLSSFDNYWWYADAFGKGL